MDVSKPSLHFIQDQFGNKEVWKTNNHEIPELSFEDIIGAKLLVDAGQNVFTVSKNEDLPSFLQVGTNVKFTA